MAQAETKSTTSRRKLLAAPAVIALAGLGAAVSRPAIADDPVVTLHRKWMPLKAEADRFEAMSIAVDNRMVARCGEPLGTNDRTCWTRWKQDPEYVEYRRLIGETDRWDNLAYDVRVNILETTATSAAGMAIKLQHILDGFPPDIGGEAWETDAQAGLREAVRFLTRGTVA
jgi:hypothetical protein